MKFDKDVLILNQKSDHTISFYDLDTGKAVHHIRLPDYPHEFVVDKDEKYAYVGHYGVEGSDVIDDNGGSSVFVLDITQSESKASGAWIHTLRTWPYRRIHGVALDSQNRLYAMSETDSTLVRFSKPLEQEQPDMAVASGGEKTHLFALSQDGETAFSVNLLSNTVCKIKPNDPTFTPIPLMTGNKPEGNCLAKDEKTLYITNRNDNTVVAIDTDSMSIKHTAKAGTNPIRVYEMADGNLLVINFGETFLTKFSPDLEELGKIDIGGKAMALSLHPNGKAAFLSLQGDTLAILDLDSNKITKQFDTLKDPDVSYLLKAQ